MGLLGRGEGDESYWDVRTAGAEATKREAR
jgi:hypothetical protein